MSNNPRITCGFTQSMRISLWESLWELPIVIPIVIPIVRSEFFQTAEIDIEGGYYVCPNSLINGLQTLFCKIAFVPAFSSLRPQSASSPP